ncbi:DUF4160 domain-containing protein [Mongoliimonas terrestris]|uniref:DUF4160 domain-containing protein n=1 Tax=Mongoliimonas terrestris TaxID=1709001 RepID=UPI0009498068
MTVHIYANDHPPPHVHVRAGDREALISIATGDTLRGSIPKSKANAFRVCFVPRQDWVAFCWVEFQAGRSIEGPWT